MQALETLFVDGDEETDDGGELGFERFEESVDEEFDALLADPDHRRATRPTLH